jgi:glycosyltransferase involved in cell wall biosynthesis
MERDLRILFLDTRPIRRGAQIFLHELKHRLLQENLPVRRIFLYEETKYEHLPLDEYDLVLPFRDNHFFEKIPTIQPKLVKALAREIKNFTPDVILCNGSRTLKYAAFVKKCYPSIKTKWIYRVIDSAKYWNKRSLTKYYYKYVVIPSMDGAVGVSQKSLNEMINHYGFKKPFICIPRSVDVDYFANFQPEIGVRKSLGIPNDAFVFLFLGNFTRQKRPDRFIEIIDCLKKDMPNVHGLMVGDGPLKNESEKQVKNLGLHGRITFAGYQQDVRPWISISDVLFLTSDTEGMPGVVLEAAAMKVSVISGNVGGVSEFIENGYNGLILDWNITECQLNSIIDFLVNSERIEKSRELAFKEVQENFSIINSFNRYITFFKTLS